jgi:hypothetical protein
MTRSFVPITSMLMVFLSVACGYDNGDVQRTEPNEAVVVPGSIDTGATMTNVDSGVGVFVEYATGGKWTLQVGCDTATTDLDCLWDIYAYTPIGDHILSSESIDLESDDVLTVQSDGELWLSTTIGADLDGVSFVTEPGEPVTFDLLLDGERHPERFFFYISSGSVVNGEASPVIELRPTES